MNLSAAARERLGLLAGQLGCSRSELVDAIVRGYSLDELRDVVRRVRTRDGDALVAWGR